MSMTAKLTRTTPTLTASEFLDHLQANTLPKHYIVKEYIHFGNLHFPNGVDFQHGIIEGGVYFGRAIIERGVFYERATIEGGVFYERATIEGGVFYNGAIIKGGVFYDGATIEGSVLYDGANIEGSVLYDGANIEGGVFYDGATIEGSVFYDGATIEGRVHAGSNPALAWLFAQHRHGIIYSTADARLMCGHPRPMKGWQWDDAARNFVFTGT